MTNILSTKEIIFRAILEFPFRIKSAIAISIAPRAEILIRYGNVNSEEHKKAA